MEGLKHILTLVGGLLLEALALVGRVLGAPFRLLLGRSPSAEEHPHDHETLAERKRRHLREKEAEAKFQRRLILLVSLLVLFLVVISLQDRESIQNVINGEGFTLVDKEKHDLPPRKEPPKEKNPVPAGEGEGLAGSGEGLAGKGGAGGPKGGSGHGDGKGDGKGGADSSPGQDAASRPAAKAEAASGHGDGGGDGKGKGTSGDGQGGGDHGAGARGGGEAGDKGGGPESAPALAMGGGDSAAAPGAPALSGRLELVNVTLGSNRRNEQSVLGQVVNGMTRPATRVVVTVGFLDAKGKVLEERKVNPLVVSGGLFGDITTPLPPGESRAFELGVLPPPKGWSGKVTTTITQSEFAP